ncbi:hypothetical protein I9W82_004075 [Candida metapsilosis]|uniref:Uncharacterized protein n=1 Tax=Candida metapsilosis TaxID=273372 RepID=A0A8H7ZH45_9ASCO|nr:hypothetical protein I9W82_004075 [Candida metapsilosis]
MSQEISLSLSETNKIRTKLGLRPIEENPTPPSNVIELSLEETNKLRLSLGLKPIPKESTTHDSGAVASKPPNRVNNELLSQKLAKAKVVSEKRKLLDTTQEDEEDEIDTDSWLSNIGNTHSAKKQKIEQAPSKKQSQLINAHIGHSTKELQNLRNNDILTLQDTDLLHDDNEGDILVNEALTEDAKVQRNLNERREAEMIKFNGRHYKRSDAVEEEGDTEGIIKKSPVVIKNSSISLSKSENETSEKVEVPPNTTKFTNFFDNLEESSDTTTTTRPQIKMKKLKKRKPLDTTRATVSTRVKSEEFEQLPDIDEDDYTDLQDNLIYNSSKSKQGGTRPKMTPEEIALEIARNKKIAMERRLEEESMRRQYSAVSDVGEKIEDLDTIGFLSNLEQNILKGDNEQGDAIDEDDIFDVTEVTDNGHSERSKENGSLSVEANGDGHSDKGDLSSDTASEQTNKERMAPPDNQPKFNTGLADTLKFLKSRSDENYKIQQAKSNSSSLSVSREELAKQSELLKLKINIEERILRDELSKDKEYMKLSKAEREVKFETELDKRLVEKGIVVEGEKSNRFNRGGGGRKNGSIQRGTAAAADTKTITLNTSGDKYATYNPKVELNYKDDEGKLLDTKQAYKHLSHKYHGMTTSQRIAKNKKKREKEKSNSGNGPVIKDRIVD